MNFTDYDDASLRLCTRTFEAMGTVISISAPLASSEVEAATETAERVFVDANERFSPFLPTSELSRINRGELFLPEASQAMREVFALASDFEYRTNRNFTPYAPDGSLDLNGVVKAWAIRGAGDLLDTLGVPHWSINAGGDVLVSGSPFPAQPSVGDSQYGSPFFGTPWTLGIVDPHDSSLLLAALEGTGTPGFRTALATSGIAERGEHIWTAAPSGPTTTAPNSRIIQVSVTGPDIVTADALATALAAGGTISFTLLSDFPGYEALAVLSDASLVKSLGWPAKA